MTLMFKTILEPLPDQSWDVHKGDKVLWGKFSHVTFTDYSDHPWLISSINKLSFDPDYIEVNTDEASACIFHIKEIGKSVVLHERYIPEWKI